jgi:hypothetical protein
MALRNTTNSSAVSLLSPGRLKHPRNFRPSLSATTERCPSRPGEPPKRRSPHDGSDASDAYQTVTNRYVHYTSGHPAPLRNPRTIQFDVSRNAIDTTRDALEGTRLIRAATPHPRRAASTVRVGSAPVHVTSAVGP